MVVVASRKRLDFEQGKLREKENAGNPAKEMSLDELLSVRRSLMRSVDTTNSLLACKLRQKAPAANLTPT